MKKLKILLSLLLVINMSGCTSKEDTSFKGINSDPIEVVIEDKTVNETAQEAVKQEVEENKEDNTQPTPTIEVVDNSSNTTTQDNSSNNSSNESTKQDNTSSVVTNTEQPKEVEQPVIQEETKEDTSYLNVINRGGYNNSVYYYYNIISDNDKETYNQILNGLNNHDEEIDVYGDFESIKKIVYEIFYDHPEIFWSQGAFQYNYYEGSLDAVIKFEYTYDVDTTNQYKDMIENVVSSFKSTISSSDSDYEVIKKVYCYTIDNVSYDINSEDNQNIVSSMINHSSVCAGYSKMSQYLLQRCGLKALYVTGTANGVEHAWVIVKWSDNYYHIDTTFADGYNTSSSELSNYNYPYLCLSDTIMFKNHTPDYLLSIPECSSDILSKFTN